MRWVRSALARRLAVVERLSYLFLLLPVLIAVVDDDILPWSARQLIAALSLGALTLAFIFLLRRTRQEIEKLELLKQGLAEAIVHDLKTPISTILATLQAMLERSPDPAKQREFLRMAVRGCKSQVLLAETLLDVDRLESAALKPSMARVETRKLLEEALGDIGFVAEALGVRTSLSAEPAPPPIVADEELLRRILLNLLQNALKYSRRGGEVKLAFRLEGPAGDAVFEVSDKGTGIPAAHLERVFARFYRVEGTDQGERPGTGLGLYFSRLAVEAHGGRISAASRPGLGSTLTFSIPQRGQSGGASGIRTRE